MTRVLVTGVRGKTGVPLAGLLAARPEVEVWGGSSDPSTVTIDGVRPVAFSWDDPAGWPAATTDVDAVYVVRPDREDAPELIGRLLGDLAPATRVVLLSERNADEIEWSVRSEEAVRGSGRAWAILRPGWFLQVFSDPRFYLDEIRAGGLMFPSGGAELAWIDARDIAAVAERALLDDDLVGRVLELTGPESLSLPRTAELLSRAVGREVVHHETTIDEAVEGLEGFERELTVLTFERVRRGSFTTVTDTVAQVTGRPARSLADFAADGL